MSASHVTVRIYGENYPLRTAEPAARLEELAKFVDGRMREVAASGKVVATGKIAVLAALYIADELFRAREAPARNAAEEPGAAAAADPEFERRLQALADTLERALSTPAAGA